MDITFLGQCKEWGQAGLTGSGYGGFAYAATNRDALDQDTGTIYLPTVITYFDNGRVQVSSREDLSGYEVKTDAKLSWGTQSVTVQLGPGQGKDTMFTQSVAVQLGPGQSDTILLPVFDWADNAKPEYVMLVPNGEDFKQAFGSAPVYSVECSSS